MEYKDIDAEDYVIIRKDIFKRYGAFKGVVLQTLIDLGGKYEGTVYNFSRMIDSVSRTTIRTHILQLCKEEAILMRNLYDNVYRISINQKKCDEESKVRIENFRKEEKKRTLPREVMYHLQRIKEIREEKMKKICEEMGK